MLPPSYQLACNNHLSANQLHAWSQSTTTTAVFVYGSLMVPEIAFRCLRGRRPATARAKDGTEKNEDEVLLLATFIKTRMTPARMRFRARRAVKPPSVFCALVDGAVERGCEQPGREQVVGHSSDDTVVEGLATERREEQQQLGASDMVEGMVIFGVGAEELGRLDRFEAGLYAREEGEVEVGVLGDQRMNGDGETEMVVVRVETYMWAGSVESLVGEWSLERFVQTNEGRVMVGG